MRCGAGRGAAVLAQMLPGGMRGQSSPGLACPTRQQGRDARRPPRSSLRAAAPHPAGPRSGGAGAAAKACKASPQPLRLGSPTARPRHVPAAAGAPPAGGTLLAPTNAPKQQPRAGAPTRQVEEPQARERRECRQRAAREVVVVDAQPRELQPGAGRGGGQPRTPACGCWPGADVQPQQWSPSLGWPGGCPPPAPASACSGPPGS